MYHEELAPVDSNVFLAGRSDMLCRQQKTNSAAQCLQICTGEGEVVHLQTSALPWVIVLRMYPNSGCPSRPVVLAVLLIPGERWTIMSSLAFAIVNHVAS